MIESYFLNKPPGLHLTWKNKLATKLATLPLLWSIGKIHEAFLSSAGKSGEGFSVNNHFNKKMRKPPKPSGIISKQL